VAAIELWTEHWNDDPKPFVWHKGANKNIEKVRRGRSARTSAAQLDDSVLPRA
jgi:hypothetical protein